MKISRRMFGATLAAGPLFALPPRPKLLVLIVAEQFRSDYFDSHSNVFGSGGFQRLLSGGSYFPNCFLESTTFTSSALATLSTGTYPSVHGIVADRWFDRSVHEVVTARPELLEATTFVSRFQAEDPRNRVFGIGFDMRSTAILSGGVPFVPKPDLAAKASWSALGAKSNEIMRVIDPASADFAAAWKASPFGQAAQFGIAGKIITDQKLGHGDGVDLLCIVLGSLGAAGLEGGAATPLVFDLVSQLDRELESLMSLLDDALGETSYQIAFTAAHGAVDAATARIAGKDVVAAMPQDCKVEAYVYPGMYLRSGSPEAAGIAAVRAGKANAWYTANGRCSHTGVWQRRLQNSFHSRRSGEILLAYGPGVVEDFAGGRGVSYGSIYNYDACVPLILYGPQFRAAEYERSIELIDVAPTLARAMGTGMPSSSTGRVLGEAFAANSSSSVNR
jgi:hypothetical protein